MQASTNLLTPDWFYLTNLTAGTNGIYETIDTPPANTPKRSSSEVGRPSSAHRLNAFSPTTPETINATHTSLAASRDSLRKSIPKIAVPAAPIPVQMA